MRCVAVDKGKYFKSNSHVAVPTVSPAKTLPVKFVVEGMFSVEAKTISTFVLFRILST